MADFESVTFGGSGFDRAAELRSDAAAMAQAMADDTSRSLVFWRGKPLTQAGDEAHLLRLPMDHEVLKRAIEAPIFLGRENTGYVFATDISSWEPAAQDMPEAVFLDQTEQHFPGLPKDHLFLELRTIMARLSARDAELAAMAKSLFSWHSIHRFCAKCGSNSNVVQAGWQRVCGSCNAMHFPRTDPVVIMLITHGNKVLLGRSPYWPEGMYSLLAGFLEPGETPEAAVRREVYEETGVSVGSVRYLGSQPWAFPSSLMLGFSGEALGTEITLDPVELEDAIWVSREVMMQIFEGTHPTMRRPRSGAIAHYILKNWLEDCLE